MNIAILNECFLNESHQERLKKIGNLSIYKDTNSEELAIERLQDIDIAIADCFISPLNRAVLSSTNKLKYITINSTGYDLVDLSAAKEKEIKVSNIPGFATEAVAEHAIALMFAVNRRISQFDLEMKKKPFEVDPEKDAPLAGFNLAGKTLGVIGLGAIGARVAELGKGLGMKVIAYNRSDKSIRGAEIVTLEELLKRSDVISIHLPLTPDTQGIIGEKELNMMKPSAILINTARGKHVEKHSIKRFLKTKFMEQDSIF
jgi:lactate dehydrogenase-like 2-hydroxyacid dehydrogenase